MRYYFLAAAVLILAGATSSPAQTRGASYRIRTDCIGDRCVLRDRHGIRLGTVTTEATGRLAVRDSNGRLQAKVTSERSGSYRVETWPRR